MEQYSSLIMLGFLAVFFYFLLIRPQMQRQKEHKKLMAALAPGDRVVTIGGLFGTLRSVGEETAQLEVASGVVIEIAKSAIAKQIEA